MTEVSSGGDSRGLRRRATHDELDSNKDVVLPDERIELVAAEDGVVLRSGDEEVEGRVGETACSEGGSVWIVWIFRALTRSYSPWHAVRGRWQDANHLFPFLLIDRQLRLASWGSPGSVCVLYGLRHAILLHSLTGSHEAVTPSSRRLQLRRGILSPLAVKLLELVVRYP